MSLPSSLRLKSSNQLGLPSSLRPKVKQKEEIPADYFESDENIDRDIERNQAQLFSRMLERTIGTPGNVASLLPNKIREAGILKHLPTSAQLREKSESLSRGYTKPKGDFEEKAGETMADVASYMLGKPGGTVLSTFARMVGIPLAGQLAEEGVSRMGGSSGQKEAAKMGTMLLLDLWGLKKGIGKGGAYKFGIDSLENAEKSIPKGAIADVSVFSKKLDKVEGALKGGLTGPHTTEALRALDEIRGHIVNGKMPAEKFPILRKDINKLIDNMKGWQFGGPPRSIKKAAVANLNQVKSSLIQAGNRWGRKNAPQFFTNWRAGNEALSVYHKSQQISDVLSKYLRIKSPIARAIFGVHHPGAYAGLMVGRKALDLGAKFPTALVYRFASSKVLRNLYSNILKEASKGNGAAVAALSAKLDKKLEKQGIKD